MPGSVETPVMLFATPADWEAWLGTAYDSSVGVLLKLAKKGSPVKSVTYAEALEVALCYGWIDGQKQALDEQFWLQKFTPRRQGSIWSKVNRQKALDLIASGRMQAPGLKQIELAKANGRWEAAYDSPANSEIPPDFQAALDQHPEAKAFFDTLNRVNRYAMYHRIQTAKKPETRQARIEKFIGMLNAHEKLYP